ncbi:MAG TPA: hypothetical protein VJQ45_08565 [Ktedonobacterales bacterium]|nr:hypothetical protein [Ktedonobacterales bacterium]
MVIARAPVRISFAGGGTDLASYYRRHGGLVVSAAIARYTHVIASRPSDGGFWLRSSDYHAWETFRPRTLPPVQEPLALPKAAIEAFAPFGLRESGVDLFLASEIPPGSGLGSSSAMAVALAHALAGYLGLPMDAVTAADMACRLEIERLGMPIGKQDQYASAFGGLNTIEFSAAGVRVTPLDLPADTVAALSSRLLLFSTGRTRNSAGILRQQSADSATKREVISSLHSIKELAYDMRDALAAEELDRFGELLHQAWAHKKKLSGKVSTSEIDAWYAAAREAGALGGKITGAGGGGFLLLYCPRRRQRGLRAALRERGLIEMPFDLDFDGAGLVSADAPPEEASDGLVRDPAARFEADMREHPLSWVQHEGGVTR